MTVVVSIGRMVDQVWPDIKLLSGLSVSRTTYIGKFREHIITTRRPGLWFGKSRADDTATTEAANEVEFIDWFKELKDERRPAGD